MIMAMVKIDFTGLVTLSSCPAWWRGFVHSATRGLKSNSDRNTAIDKMLAEAKCIAVSNPYEEGDLICLIFESEEAHREFVTYWTLMGDRDG